LGTGGKKAKNKAGNQLTVENIKDEGFFGGERGENAVINPTVRSDRTQPLTGKRQTQYKKKKKFI